MSSNSGKKKLNGFVINILHHIITVPIQSKEFIQFKNEKIMKPLHGVSSN